LYSKCLTKETLSEGYGDFKVEQVICTVKYTDDFVVMAKEETIAWE
jgi:hypothetical protein